ncbi:PDZ domain-containing protein [Candidatus Woesearchaeota archaeon]|nr:PDZ domain-containing protein [Candidatus Woesearchaeota archaeon]MBT4207218.1 PDZ domain-containing protein [Candidatus Woesearchaeota archaeon]MBT5043290.1 PDZ domain-containing protein [Candidatus Woesearchaeota archaeon]MBT5557834.1 PDZ domain-containing protein [Candidatus Woesearchaeota archaeon]
MVKLGGRVWVLIVFLFLALLVIDPSPISTGIEIRSIDSNSPAFAEGIKPGEKILEINGVKINELIDFKTETDKLIPLSQEVEITTSEGITKYEIVSSIGFKVDSNLTIIAADSENPLENGLKLLKINNEVVEDVEGFNRIISKLITKNKFILKTNKADYAFLTTGDHGITARKAKTSNIEKGLELQGGTRVMLKPISEEPVSAEDINNIIDVMHKRMNIYGLADIKIRPAKDLDGTRFVLIEIAGATREEVKEIISKQGVFEAKIGEETVFEGGKKDIPYVCRDDGSCAVIESCNTQSPEVAYCNFRFAITLSADAAKKHAEITDKLEINYSGTNAYLSKPLDLYLDGKLVDTLLISESLKGEETTQISISGSGNGATEEIAYNDAIAGMNNLQTVLITGSLPHKLEIVKMDTISPMMGKAFIKNAFLAGFLALFVVGIVVYIRYRKFKIILPMAFTSVSEVILILGFAALFKWNLDLAAIAGIIAAVGTGIDDQIIIADEVLKQRIRVLNWKEKIKRAFFIIFSAYATTVVAMLPLMFAGAGLLKQFAITTIAGVTIGVLITRPAFASIVEKLLD